MSSSNDAVVSEGQTLTNPKKYIRQYLCSRSEAFRELAKVQDEGWQMQSGDKHFEKQRNNADSADEKTCYVFFKLMKKIGSEMHKNIGVMSLPEHGKVLDLCMAPGGYSASVLTFNPGVSIFGATLPENLGGHKLLVGKEVPHGSLNVWQGDLTSLIGDMGIRDIDVTSAFEYFGKFQKEEVWSAEEFDLVFCDGQVLRNHTQSMAEDRQRREQSRLVCSQLLIALRHVRNGGSMVILLHQIDKWETILTLRAFDRFARIEIFKPLAAHRSRGSFYLVAKDIQIQHEGALMAVQNWTKAWKDATFGGTPVQESPDLGKEVIEAMDEFGDKLIGLAERTWQIQANAIQNAPWFKKESKLLSQIEGSVRTFSLDADI